MGWESDGQAARQAARQVARQGKPSMSDMKEGWGVGGVGGAVFFLSGHVHSTRDAPIRSDPIQSYLAANTSGSPATTPVAPAPAPAPAAAAVALGALMAAIPAGAPSLNGLKSD